MLGLDYVRTLKLIYGLITGTVKLTPIVLQDYLMLILTVPLGRSISSDELIQST